MTLGAVLLLLLLAGATLIALVRRHCARRGWCTCILLKGHPIWDETRREYICSECGGEDLSP